MVGDCLGGEPRPGSSSALQARPTSEFLALETDCRDALGMAQLEARDEPNQCLRESRMGCVLSNRACHSPPWCPLRPGLCEEPAGSPQIGRGRPRAGEGSMSRVSRRIGWGGLGVTVGCSARPSSPSPAPSDWLSVLPASRPKWSSPVSPRSPCGRGLTGCVCKAMVPRGEAGGCIGAVVPSCRMQVVDVLPLLAHQAPPSSVHHRVGPTGTRRPQWTWVVLR